MPFHKNDNRRVAQKIAQGKRRERDSANYRIWRREKLDLEERAKLEAPPQRETSAENS